MEMEVDRIGVAKNKRLGFAALFQRGVVKRSTKYRVWPVAGDDRFIQLDPSEMRERYPVIEEIKVGKGRPS